MATGKFTNGNIDHIQYAECNSLSELKSYLLGQITGMKAWQSKAIGFVTNFNDNNFPNSGLYYIGTICLESLSGTGYFSVIASDYRGHIVAISCENSTWAIYSHNGYSSGTITTNYGNVQYWKHDKVCTVSMSLSGITQSASWQLIASGLPKAPQTLYFVVYGGSYYCNAAVNNSGQLLFNGRNAATSCEYSFTYVTE